MLQIPLQTQNVQSPSKISASSASCRTTWYNYRVDQLAFYGIKMLLRVEKWIILFEILHCYQHENTDEGFTCELQSHIHLIKVNVTFFNPFQTLVLLFFPF